MSEALPKNTHLLQVEMVPQPTDSTCGPTCLHALYRFHGAELPIDRIISEVPMLDTGGTLAVNLGIHALEHGFRARLFTFNLAVFDPTWFSLGEGAFKEKLLTQLKFHRSRKARNAVRAYTRFLELGGRIELRDLSSHLIRKFLDRGLPILTGLNATFLYRCMREMPSTGEDDDERGESLGHFVVISGYDRNLREFLVADPYDKNPLHRATLYRVSADRLINAILLGIMTYDANLLILEPPRFASK